MRPNGPSQTAQRFGVQCRAFCMKSGISVSSHRRVSSGHSCAVLPSEKAGSGSSCRQIARVRVTQSTAPQCAARLR
jgi:hypothetical protein